MNSHATPVRLAGVCYLIIILCGEGSEHALHGPPIDLASAEATKQATQAAPMRLRLSIMADVLVAVAEGAQEILRLWMLRRPRRVVRAAATQTGAARPGPGL